VDVAVAFDEGFALHHFLLLVFENVNRDHLSAGDGVGWVWVAGSRNLMRCCVVEEVAASREEQDQGRMDGQVFFLLEFGGIAHADGIGGRLLALKHRCWSTWMEVRNTCEDCYTAARITVTPLGSGVTESMRNHSEWMWFIKSHVAQTSTQRLSKQSEHSKQRLQNQLWGNDFFSGTGAAA
jgi:hypothetical protein